MPTYTPDCKYDISGQGYDESAYDRASLQDAISLSITDSLIKNVTKELAENFSIIDGIHYIIFLTEAFNIIDTFVKNGVKNLSEVFSITDSKLFKIFFNEAFSVADSFIKYATKYVSEIISIIDLIKLPLIFFTEKIKGTSNFIEKTKGTSNFTELRQK